jgi:hypothetical protein
MRVEAIGSGTNACALYSIEPVSKSERLARIAEREKRAQAKKDSQRWVLSKPDWMGLYVDIYV